MTVASMPGSRTSNVGFGPEIGHAQRGKRCLLSAIGGHPRQVAATPRESVVRPNDARLSTAAV